MTKSVSWFTPPVGDKNGFGYAAVCLINALARTGIHVKYLSSTERVHISWVQPDWYEGEKHQYRIGYTPWESSVVPETWPGIMNECQQIWTPTRYCKNVFESSGVTTPITVVPHGIDPNHYPIMDRTLGEHFVFLHVGGPTERKGGQKVFDTFRELFEGDHRFQLVMKVSKHSEVRYYDKHGRFLPAEDHPQVTVVSAELDVTDLAKLYRLAHCVVYPSNGEGFGFIPFQGIATGCPTIMTNGTGMSDFAYLSMPLGYRPAPGEGVHLGTWMEPDMDHLKYLMQHVVDNWEQERAIALEGAHWIHQNQTWDHIANQVLELIGDEVGEA